MDLRLNLPADLETRLESAARSEGVSASEFVVRTLEHALSDDRRSAAIYMLRRWRDEDARSNARQTKDQKDAWKAFKKGLNANHTSGRKVFP
ncbi:MAG TPA: hypothetical protein PKE29_16810 [Phycisphaerales bacterium]|nr:hypothetical protein [Phycisphaerales bacterium]